MNILFSGLGEDMKTLCQGCKNLKCIYKSLVKAYLISFAIYIQYTEKKPDYLPWDIRYPMWDNERP